MPAVLSKKQKVANATNVAATSEPRQKKNLISPAFVQITYPISSFKHDPDNARLHPENNIEAVMQSLSTYGQKKPIVVRKQDMTVYAGNGTMQAAENLGWTHIAANVEEMTMEEAHGYALADNRTAELAKWDFEVVSRLQKLHEHTGHGTIGWTADQLEVLRMAEWHPPALDEAEIKEKPKPILIETVQQRTVIDQAIQVAKDVIFVLRSSEGTEADCLVAICEEFLERCQK